MVYEAHSTSNDQISSCQLGLNSTDVSKINSLFSTFESEFVSKFVSGGNRKKRAVASDSSQLKCDDFKKIGKGLKGFTSDQLSKLNPNEVKTCQTFLGTIDTLTSDQLIKLAEVAKKVN